jgi:hypothetical protein
MSVAGLVEAFSELDDRRMVGKVDHSLIDIVVITACPTGRRPRPSHVAVWGVTVQDVGVKPSCSSIPIFRSPPAKR